MFCGLNENKLHGRILFLLTLTGLPSHIPDVMYFINFSLYWYTVIIMDNCGIVGRDENFLQRPHCG